MAVDSRCTSPQARRWLGCTWKSRGNRLILGNTKPIGTVNIDTYGAFAGLGRKSGVERASADAVVSTTTLFKILGHERFIK